VWEANAVPRFYVNGVQVATVGTATIPSIYNNVGVPLHIARSTYNTARYLKGSLDEIRISNPARSAGYILTCYNNQLNPAAFYTISPEEGLPAEPLVKNPSPANDATNVPVTITELSFDIQDYQQDLMNVTVTTSPNIGVASLKDVSNGRYAVSVSGLAYSTTYTWTVTATDGTYTTIKTYCFTTELAPAADDIIFNSNFDMGNLINVTYVEGRPGYRHYLAATRYTIGVDPAHTGYTARTNNDKHWWFYFSMENVAGKTIAVSIVNGTDADWSTSDTNGNRWPEIEPVYSYDNINWYRVPLSGVTYDRTAKRFTINITVPAGITKVWLAPLPPYNIARRDALFAEFEGNPYLTVTSLGTTPGGQELKVATITDPAYSAEGKFKSYVIAQQHPGEVPGSWNAEGLIRFLLSDDPTAAAIRRSYIFRIIPIVNVDGVYQGICRYTPVRNGYQYDLNRWWNIPPSNDAPFEVRVIYQDIQAFKPHSFNDFHSTINTEQLSPKEALTYRYSTVTTEYTNFMDKIKAGGWPETVRAASTLAGGAFQNVLSRLGVAFSLSWENPHDELSTNPGVKLTTNDWMNWGKAWAIGNYLYFGDAKATLKVTTNGNGLVTKDPDYANYTYGTSVQLTATAAEGYIFSRWEGDLTGNLNPATIIMTGNKTINAVFVEKTYRLNINIDGSGLVIRNNTGPYHYGDVVELTAVPSPDWDFAGWSGDITSTDNPVIITITKDTEVTARFTGQYALTINVIGAGTVVKSPNKPFYKYGEPVELTAVADPGWTFSGWSGDLSGNENPVTITVTSEKTITATFTANNWWNSNWKYRRTITIDRTKVAADQTNFPVLIDITDVGLTSKAQPDGDDFVFTTANNVKLNHEIESYDSTTGRLVAWVNVPYLSSTVDTVLYLYYGNSACGNQQNPSAVWDSSYKLVLHLNEQAGIHSDSSVYSNNGAPVNGVLQGVPSKIDGGDTFDGVNDYIEIAHSNTLTGYTTAFSVGFWVRLQDTSRRQTIINKYDTTGNQRGWFVEYDPTVRPTRPFAFFASNDGINYREWYASFVPSAGVWYYVVVVWEANAVPRFYVNGVQVATVGTATIPSIYNNPNTPLFIGRCPYNTARYFSGSLDEITISNPARSASWIQTSYNNQLNPAAFYDISGEETFAEYYTLTIYKVGQGTVSADPQKQYYKSGDTVTLTATPESGYTFQNWSGDLTGTNNPATIVVTRNMAVTAHFIIKQYTITSSISGEGGTISPSGLVAVSHGADQTFTITPDEGYHILDVLVDGESQGAIATYTFTNVNADHTITATFARNEYTLTVQFSPEGSGTVALNNTGPYYHGDVVELTAEPNSGWYFLEWAGDLSGSQNPASIIMDGDKTITATFTQQQQQQYTLTITIVGGGSVEANPSKTQYNAGEEVMLTATADAGYSFAGWSGDIISTDNPLTLIMGSSKSLTATFTQDQYTLTVNIDGQGSVTLNPDQTTYTYNAAVELTATAAAGWEFSHWSGALTGSESSATLIITGDAVVTAHFTQIPQSQHTLVINIVGNGVVTKTPDQTTYADGATVELAATAASGWTFSHWSGDAAGTSNPITITMDGDKTVTAYFAQMLLTDSTFDASSSSEVLRDNSEGQDWYESRGAFSNGNPALLTLDTNDIGGNNGKKAALKNYGIADATSNAYLTQELSTTYSGIYPLSFELSFDIYIDKIENNGDFDRTGHIYIGDDSNTANAPTGAAYERFVLLAFYDPTPGDSGTDLELRARTLNTDAQSWSNTALWEQVATGLSYDTWYTIKIVINTASGTYDVYINGVLARAGISKMNDYPASNPIKYVTFSADSDGRGDFYIDNVKATLIESYNGVHFAGAGAGIAGTGSTLQPSYPSGLQTGDLILLQVTVRDTTNIPTTPTGFTLLYGPNSTGTGRQWIYYKISDGTETGTITITIAGSAVKVARMYAFRNTATTDFAESAAFTSGLGTTISAPSSVTTSGNNQLVVAFVFVTYNNAVSSFTGETGGDWQETIPEYTTTSGSRGCIQLQTAMMFSAGTITGGSCTMTSSQAWGVLAFAIKPAI
ncbi:MAG: M14-type cytosolic carboxypeptidase, partial [Candidatus Bathyarchaeia archaeon]